MSTGFLENLLAMKSTKITKYKKNKPMRKNNDLKNKKMGTTYLSTQSCIIHVDS